MKRRGPVGVNYVTPASQAQSPSGFFDVQEVPESTVLYEPGAASDKVFLVRKGRVRLYRPRRGGAAPALTALLGPGDLFGELYRPQGSTGTERAVVAEQSEIWSIDGDEFRKQLGTKPEFAADVVRMYAERVQLLKQRLWSVGIKDAPARLAETLLELVEAHGSPCEHGGEKELRGITQQDLADLSDISRSLASTIINELKRDEVLANAGRALCILDMDALRALAAREKYLAA